MAEPASDDPQTKKLTVFVSYSRDDVTFADQLVALLELQRYDVTIDRHAMSAGEQFETRLGVLILDADVVVFVLSPTSAISKMCRWEIDEAVRLGKRILPLVARPLDDTPPPENLTKLNLDWIYAYPEPKTPGSGWGTGVSRLVTALTIDVVWVRELTRLLRRATEWQVAGQPNSRLLFGEQIKEARDWIESRPKSAPEPTTLHHDFIRASETAAIAQQQADDLRPTAPRRLSRRLASSRAGHSRDWWLLCCWRWPRQRVVSLRGNSGRKLRDSEESQSNKQSWLKRPPRPRKLRQRMQRIARPTPSKQR
jgi:TIR domain